MDDEGAASVMVFIVAGVLFLGVVALLLTTVVNKIPPSTAAQQVDSGHGLEARSLLNRFVVASGQGYNATDKKWQEPATPGEQPGLGDGEGSLDRSKLNALVTGLNNGGDAPAKGTASDGLLDYFEARARLDLDNRGLAGFQFYLVIQFTSGGDACPIGPAASPLRFGPPPPVDVALEPAAKTFQMVGDCDGNNVSTALTTVDVSLVVFKASLAS